MTTPSLPQKLRLPAILLLLATLTACPGGSGPQSVEADDDGDGLQNSKDLCANTPTSETANADGCSPSQLDSDSDGRSDAVDQCPNTPSNETANADGCAPSQLDTDGDSVNDRDDECASTPANETAASNGCSPSQTDSDNDGINDDQDNCINTGNNDQADQDMDNIGNACDDDVDGDGDPNDMDNCPVDPNPGQEDNDMDGTGNVCDNPPDTGSRASALPDCYDATMITANSTEAHICTWNRFAHGLQRQLDANTPMRESLWIASHNSYNYPNPLVQSSSDPNQSVDITTQLTLEMRGLEIDIHWQESPRCSGQLATLVCHSQGDHSTCSGTEPTSDTYFAEIRTWLDANPDEIIQVDIEGNFNIARVPPCPPGAPDPTGGDPYEIVGNQLSTAFGTLIYTPSDSQNAQLPLEVTRQEILDLGKRVIVTGNLNAGWDDVVHGLDVRDQHVHDGIQPYPGCGWFEPASYRNRWTRLWEDSTNVANAFVPEAEPVTSEVIIEMLKCGLNMPSIDKFTSSDARLATLVWSWAEQEPAVNAEENCASHNSDGRFVSADCDDIQQYACLNSSTQTWTFAAATSNWDGGVAACAALNDGSVFATPETGYFNQLLRDAKTDAALTDVWVNYREDATTEGVWTPR